MDPYHRGWLANRTTLTPTFCLLRLNESSTSYLGPSCLNSEIIQFSGACGPHSQRRCSCTYIGKFGSQRQFGSFIPYRVRVWCFQTGASDGKHSTRRQVIVKSAL